MTVLSSETQLLGSGTTSLPRVNLLPPEIAEKRSFQRIQIGLGAAGLCAVAVVGLLYVSATHGVSSANSELAQAKAQSSSLQSQVLKYRDVESIYSAAAAAQAQLSLAMGDEVRFSQLLNDLSLSMPSSVWLTNVSFTQTPPTAVGSATGVTTPTGATPRSASTAPIGTFTVTGVGFSHDDVAVWLESVSKLASYNNPYFSNSTEALLGTRKIVNFNSTAEITSKALSGRYTKPVGG